MPRIFPLTLSAIQIKLLTCLQTYLLSLPCCGAQCTVASSTLLYCPSPRLPAVTSPRRRHVTSSSATSWSVREYRVSFVMDGVETVRDLSVHFPDVRSLFRIYPDPVFDQFRAGRKIYKGEALILTVCFLCLLRLECMLNFLSVVDDILGKLIRTFYA